MPTEETASELHIEFKGKSVKIKSRTYIHNETVLYVDETSREKREYSPHFFPSACCAAHNIASKSAVKSTRDKRGFQIDDTAHFFSVRNLQREQFNVSAKPTVLH